MSIKAEREHLLRIISTCIDMERKGTDPFEIEIKEILDILRKNLPNWKILEEFVLDSEALKEIATIINLQGDWIKHRSTSLYVDPLLIELKIKTIDARRLVNIFIKAWNPIAELEGLTKRRIDEAIVYWNQLLPLKKRIISLPTPLENLKSTSFEELLKLRLLSKKTFNETLLNLWQELKDMAAGQDQIPYWRFIWAETYEETVYRAYMTSFLITYGYTTIVVNPLEEEVFLIPYEKIIESRARTQSISIPIVIDFEMWKQMRGKKV